MAERRAQGALEYLITYGWAILIIVIIGGALFALGIFNPNTWTTNKRSTGFTAFQIKDWVFLGTTDTSNINVLELFFQNKAGYPILLHYFQTIGSATCDMSVVGAWEIDADNPIDTMPIMCNTTGIIAKGAPYTLTVFVHYEANGLNHTDFGTLSGKAE